MKTVYVAIKSKVLSAEFVSAIDKSNIAKVADRFYTQKECREKLSAHTPDMLVLGLDLQEKNKNWIEFCEEVRCKYPGIKILAVTSYVEYCIFKSSLNRLASGYISMDALSVEIDTAVKAIIAGEFFRYDKIAGQVTIEKPNVDRLRAGYLEMIEILKNANISWETAEKVSHFLDETENTLFMMLKSLCSEANLPAFDVSANNGNLIMLMEKLLIKGFSNWEIADMLNVNVEMVRENRIELIVRIRGTNSMEYAPAPNVNNIVLTRRERQILRLIAAGYTDKDIANTLLISKETISYDRKEMLEKFNTKKSISMVISALRLGLIKMEDI